MPSEIIYVLIAVFIIYEVWLSLTSARKTKSAIDNQRSWIRFLNTRLSGNEDEAFSSLQPDQRNFPAVGYLASCEDHGQQVNPDNFRLLLTSKINQEFGNLNSTINTLPIIGLMGTFFGIILGITNIDLRTENISDAIQPLISSAGLAFSSSFVALLCASILKGNTNRWRKGVDGDVDFAVQTLLTDYLPHISGTTTDEIFAKSVRRLERSVKGFADSFQTVSTDFIAKFKPLVEEQRDSNEKTAKHIDSISVKLDENATVLKAVSDQQKEQVEAVTAVTKKLSEASDSLQASMKLASENLEKFVKLGDDMQTEIKKLNDPLKEALTGQKESVETLKTLYKDLSSYNTSVDTYLKTLNGKMDKFGEVGDKVLEVRTDFENFKKTLETTLKQITEQAVIIQKEIKDSFGEYNRSLKTLFADVINNQRDVHMSYYDPEVMKQVAKLSKDNNTLLDNMEKYLETLESNTMTLVGTINSLRGWGIYRVKKDKNKERKKTIKKDEGK